MLRFDRNQQNSVKQLSFNKKANYIKKSVLLHLLCGDLYMAHHGYRPGITILC